jgi:hypothetical protein
VALTAGVCEEILFRGVLGWYFGTWLGAWAGQSVVLVLFGAAHLYQGVAGALGTMVVGAMFGGVVPVVRLARAVHVAARRHRPLVGVDGLRSAARAPSRLQSRYQLRAESHALD